LQVLTKKKFNEIVSHLKFQVGPFRPSWKYNVLYIR